MKTYNNLWEQFISIENFESAAKKAIKSKKSKKSVQQFMKNKDALLKKLASLPAEKLIELVNYTNNPLTVENFKVM